MGQDKFCTIVPYVVAPDATAVTALRSMFDEFVERTSVDPNSSYYGFSVAGTEVHWRESYADAATVLASLESRSLLPSALTIAELARLEVQGPTNELAVLRTHLRTVTQPVFVERTESRYEKWLRRTQPTLDYIDAMLTRRRTAVDAGAAEGLITAWMADRFDLVHAFEPARMNFARLTANDWNGHVCCHNVALGDRSDVLAMEGSGHSARIALTERNDAERVRVCSLDSFGLANVDLIKMDVEGFETRVIAGATRLIDECRPLIMFERKPHRASRYNDGSPQVVLETHGYKVVFKGPVDTVMTYRDHS